MMSLRSPGFLAALLLAAIPVALYLLFRLRRREVRWGASYVLDMTLRTSRKESRWRQYVVLAVRTLMLILLALAFCAPLVSGGRGFGGTFPRGGSGTLARVILLDNSGSMEAEYGGATRYAEARRLAGRLLKGASGGDSFVVVPLCGDHGPQHFAPPYREREVHARLGEVEVLPEATDPAGALEAACRHFLTSVTDVRQLIVLSDFAEKDFREPDSLRPFAGSLRDLGVACHFQVVASPEDYNVALLGAEFGTDRVMAGQPYNLYVDVANYGSAPRLGDRLRLLSGGEEVRQAELELVPNERKAVPLSVELPAGEHVLELRIGEDVFEADNSLHVAVAARPALRVLLLRHVEDAEKGFESEGEFLHRALESASEKGAYKIELSSASPAMVTPERLAETDVVLCAGLERLGEKLHGELKSFLRRGGGLVIGLSPETDADAYAPVLADLFGIELLGPYAEKVNYERHQFIQRSGVSDTLLREFSTKLNADLSKARVYNHFRVRIAPGGPGEPLLRLANGDALLVRARCGRGTAMLWTSTLGGRWSSLVVRQAFLPFLCRLLDSAASGGEPARNVSAGEPIICQAPTEADLFMLTPASVLAKLDRALVGGAAYIRFEDTAAPGLYTLSDREGNALRWFTVAPAHGESDVRALSPEHKRALGDAFGASFTRSEAELREAMASAGQRLDVTWLVVLAVMALIALECLLLRVWF